MPNYVFNKLVATPEVIAALANNEGGVSFGNIIPAPDYDDPIFTAERTDFRDDEGNIAFSGWGPGYSPLDWARQNWGTKWDAMDTARESEDTVSFLTAWEPPLPVITELSRMFPDETLRLVYANEEKGRGCGVLVFRGTRVVSISPFLEGTEEAKAFSEKIWGGASYDELSKEWD